MELLGDFSVTIVEKLYPWKTWRDDFFKVFLVSTRLTLATKNWNGSKTLGSVLKNKFKSSAQISNQNIRKMYVTNLSFLALFYKTWLYKTCCNVHGGFRKKTVRFVLWGETGNTEVVGFLLRVPVAGVKKCHNPNKLWQVSFLFLIVMYTELLD